MSLLRHTPLWSRAALVLWIGPMLASAPGLARETLDVGVRYRSQDSVYLETGTAGGLTEGDRLAVYRGERRIGEIEVTFVAEHSASCRIVEETLPIQTGDRARRVAAGSQAAEHEDGAAAAAPAAESPPDEPSAQAEPRSTYAARDVRPPRARRTRVSGVLELGWDSFQDDSGGNRDFDRLSARFNLRMRNIGGRPLHLRVRLRAQENQRSRAFGSGAPESERRDRFYEASVLYDPERGRFKAQAGRIAVSPFVAVGYLDGLIGQVRLIRGIDVGALFGSQPVFESDTFAETRGQKYGAFTRFSALYQGDRPDLEIFVAGVREEGDLDVSREYVALETRYVPGGRWSLYQRAEIDLNNGWREEVAGKSSQLSNLALTLNTEISRFSRFSLSYDRWERYLTEESRSLDEEFFDDLLRQGLRARYSYSKPRGMSFSIYAGYRDREGDKENTTSFGGALRYANLANLGIAIGGDVLGYSNPLTEGVVARLRSSKRFSGGHEVALVIGGRFYSDKIFEAAGDRSDQWVRLSGWVEIPYNLFARAEFEYADGDDLQGQRILLSIGYRL